MSSFRRYGTLCQIIIIVAFLHAQTIVPVSASIGDIVGNITDLCEKIEDLPSTLCGSVATFVKTKMDGLCNKLVEDVCGLIIFPFSLVISEGTCEEDLRDTICELDDVLIDHVKEECIEELQKMFIAPHCDSDGKPVDYCQHMPTTASNMCSFMVDTACDKLPASLSPFEFVCQDTFGFLCDI